MALVMNFDAGADFDVWGFFDRTSDDLLGGRQGLPGRGAMLSDPYLSESASVCMADYIQVPVDGPRQRSAWFGGRLQEHSEFHKSSAFRPSGFFCWPLSSSLILVKTAGAGNPELPAKKIDMWRRSSKRWFG